MRGFERFVDDAKVVTMGAPVLLNTAGIAGDYVSMKNYSRLAIILSLTPASGTDAAAVTLKQAKTVDNSPVTEKALSFTKMYRQVAAGGDALVETVVANDTFSTSAAAVQETFIIEIDETDLDINNGFDCVRIAVADPGSVSTPAVAIGILYQAKVKTAPANMPSAIID